MQDYNKYELKMPIGASIPIRARIYIPNSTYNITKDCDWSSENSQLLFEMTARYGIPYFQSFVKSNLDPSEVRAMCYRLLLDLKEFY